MLIFPLANLVANLTWVTSTHWNSAQTLLMGGHLAPTTLVTLVVDSSEKRNNMRNGFESLE